MLTEQEWDDQYQWLATEMEGGATLLSDSNTAPAIRKLLEVADEHFIWTQMDDDDGGYLIVPGFQRSGIGWYVTAKPWETGDERAKLPTDEE